MATTTAIPLTVSPEASARIAELGMQAEFEQMLEHTRQTVPRLHSIEVILAYDPCPTVEPMVVIEPHRDEPPPGDDPTDREWAAWQSSTFPPNVCANFLMMSWYEATPNGR